MLQSFGGDAGRVIVGHIENGRHAAGDSSARRGFPSFLILGAGNTEMDMRIDGAPEKHEMLSIDHSIFLAFDNNSRSFSSVVLGLFEFDHC